MRRLVVSSPLSLLLVFLLLAVLPACGSKSPEERVTQIREFYSAEINGMIIEEEPVEPAMPMEVTAAEGGEPAVDEPEVVVEADEFEQLEPVEVRQIVLLDLLIKHRSAERLDGVTVDISMVDANEVEKGHWRVWFDTASIPKANPTQFSHELVDVGYVEGDGFFAEVRHPVPVEERGEYLEYSSLP